MERPNPQYPHEVVIDYDGKGRILVYLQGPYPEVVKATRVDYPLSREAAGKLEKVMGPNVKNFCVFFLSEWKGVAFILVTPSQVELSLAALTKVGAVYDEVLGHVPTCLHFSEEDVYDLYRYRLAEAWFTSAECQALLLEPKRVTQQWETDHRYFLKVITVYDNRAKGKLWCLIVRRDEPGLRGTYQHYQLGESRPAWAIEYFAPDDELERLKANEERLYADLHRVWAQQDAENEQLRAFMALY